MIGDYHVRVDVYPHTGQSKARLDLHVRDASDKKQALRLGYSAAEAVRAWFSNQGIPTRRRVEATYKGKALSND